MVVGIVLDQQAGWCLADDFGDQDPSLRALRKGVRRGANFLVGNEGADGEVCRMRHALISKGGALIREGLNVAADPIKGVVFRPTDSKSGANKQFQHDMREKVGRQSSDVEAIAFVVSALGKISVRLFVLVDNQ